LAFFTGNAQSAAFQARYALILFPIYPGSIFHGLARVRLMTLIRSAFVTHVPVELLRRFDPGQMALLVAFTGALWSAALWVFHVGLPRGSSPLRIGEPDRNARVGGG